MIIFIISVGIAAIISMFSRKNEKTKETIKCNGKTKHMEDFASKDFIPINNNLVLKSDS